ncbi:MAG: glycosyltransferase, partial [Actinobacteria bacterium]|nr:glycosyltransferase [Actinomycetota bacterium]
ADLRDHRSALLLILDWRPMSQAVDARHDMLPFADLAIRCAKRVEDPVLQGEAYRDEVRRRIHRHGLSGLVTLDGRYRDARSLGELVASADVVLLPYDSTDQVTSGVLIEAVAAGKPVVATSFPHAVELLSGGAGLVVPHRDPAGLASALRTVLTRPEVTAAMTRSAAAAAPGLRWSAVADEYRKLAARLIARAATVAA